MAGNKCKLCPIGCVDVSVCMGFDANKHMFVRRYRNFRVMHLSIEEFGLYHFYPANSVILAVTSGCNMLCSFCPMHSTVFSFSEGIEEKEILLTIINAAERLGSNIVAFYCNSLLDLDLIRSIKTQFDYQIIAMTNGFISKEILKCYLSHLDAVLLRLFGFSDTTYSRITPILGATQHIQRFIYEAASKDKHLEIEFYVIPGITRDDEFLSLVSFLHKVNPNIPLHIRRFRPCFVELDRRPTQTEEILHYYNLAKKFLHYVYAELWISPYNDTFCPNGHLVIQRFGWKIRKIKIKEGKCPICGEEIPIKM